MALCEQGRVYFLLKAKCVPPMSTFHRDEETKNNLSLAAICNNKTIQMVPLKTVMRLTV